jgi:Natural resistance-associated macrophage protein
MINHASQLPVTLLRIRMLGPCGRCWLTAAISRPVTAQSPPQRHRHPISTIQILDTTFSPPPGLITGAADDDPSGIATYSQAGAQFGFRLGWTLLLTFPLMVVIQALSARIGRTTGRGIAGNLRNYYPSWL